MLEALGLDTVAQSVYVAMLSDPAAGIPELVQMLAIAEPEVRRCLDTLADLALLRPSREQPGRLVPISPATGLRSLIRRQEEELAERHREIRASGEAAAQLIAEHAETVNQTVVAFAEEVIGLDAIQGRLEELLNQAESETMSLVPGRSIPAETLAASRRIDAGLYERGVRSRVLYQDAVRNDPATVGYGRWMADHGTLVRTAPVLPHRLLIVDRRTAVVPLNPAQPSTGALWTTAPGIVNHLVVLFERIWESATPLDEHQQAQAETGLTSTERELLKLLASGATDEAAALRLGVSVRTARRIMADLMARLGATSRFEAGLRAAQHGWL